MWIKMGLPFTPSQIWVLWSQRGRLSATSLSSSGVWLLVHNFLLPYEWIFFVTHEEMGAIRKSGAIRKVCNTTQHMTRAMSCATCTARCKAGIASHDWGFRLYVRKNDRSFRRPGGPGHGILSFVISDFSLKDACFLLLDMWIGRLTWLLIRLPSTLFIVRIHFCRPTWRIF